MNYGFAAFLIATTIGLFTACSSGPSTKGNTSTTLSEEDVKKGMICTYEVPIGSNLRERRCTTFEQREALRRQGEQLPTSPPPGGAR